VGDLSRLHRPGRHRTRAKAWYEKGEGSARLAREKLLVAEYPTLKYVAEEETGTLSLEGRFAYDSQSGIKDEIKVRVVFPFDYPDREPRAYDSDSHFPHTLERHFYDDGYADGRCCLWLPPKSKWNPNDPESLRVFLDELAIFFERQLIFDATGTWPGAEYDHGSNGYLQWIKEILENSEQLVEIFSTVLGGSAKLGRNKICPCGSGGKYKRCHLPTIDKIRKGVPLPILQRVFARH
jgi:SEC-C motif